MGQWGAFEWTGTGRYLEAEAQKLFTSYVAAEKWADARGLVVRWLIAQE
ncbi:hypothetical protein [Micromonospora sp. NPDC051006]